MPAREPETGGLWSRVVRKLFRPGSIALGAVSMAASAVLWNPLPLILWGLGAAAWAVGTTKAEEVPAAAGKNPGVLESAARIAARRALLDNPSYLGMAFKHPVNLTLIATAVATAFLAANPLVLLAAGALEGLWLILAPDSKRLRHVLWDPRFESLRQSIEAEERAEMLGTLAPVERERVEALVTRQDEIRRLAAQNPSLTGDLLRNELTKTDRLVESYVQMAVNCGRYEEYMASVDLDELERDRRQYEAQVRSGEKDSPETEIARKNLGIVLMRLEKMKEIKRYMSVARGQLDLIENSFQLIADQIVTMQSPQQLSGQLDELLDGVKAIQETSHETESILQTMTTERTT